MIFIGGVHFKIITIVCNKTPSSIPVFTQATACRQEEHPKKSIEVPTSCVSYPDSLRVGAWSNVHVRGRVRQSMVNVRCMEERKGETGDFSREIKK